MAKVDLTGQRFNSLVVIGRDEEAKKASGRQDTFGNVNVIVVITVL